MMAKDMDKTLVAEIQNFIVKSIKEEVKSRYGYDVRWSGGRYNTNSASLKIELTKPASDLASGAREVDGDALKSGFAPAGTAIEFGGEKYIIIKACRTKYVIEKQDSPGERYKLAFRAAIAVQGEKP